MVQVHAGATRVHEGCHFDANDLGERLRPIDKLECRVVGGRSPAAALRSAMCHSSRWWCITIDDRVEGAFGVAPILEASGAGAPWFLSTHAVFQGEALKRFVNESPKYLSQICQGYTFLFNYVSEHNHKSLRFLRRLGFSLGGTHYFKHYPFVEFSLCVSRPQSLSA